MPSNTSFSYAVFRRLQAAYVAGIGTATGGHMDPVNPMGGFCLLYPGNPNGILGKIANNNAMGLAGLAPLAPTAAASPLYNMFSAGLGAPDTIPNNVAVGGQMWPIMPPPEQVDPPPALGTQIDQLWLGFNTGSPPPPTERLDGVVNGVKALLALLGKGMSPRWTRGAVGPVTPWATSRAGTPFVTRQISRPWTGSANKS